VALYRAVSAPHCVFSLILTVSIPTANPLAVEDDFDDDDDTTTDEEEDAEDSYEQVIDAALEDLADASFGSDKVPSPEAAAAFAAMSAAAAGHVEVDDDFGFGSLATKDRSASLNESMCSTVGEATSRSEAARRGWLTKVRRSVVASLSYGRSCALHPHFLLCPSSARFLSALIFFFAFPTGGRSDPLLAEALLLPDGKGCTAILRQTGTSTNVFLPLRDIAHMVLY
jgi:hypothetical protein